MPSSLQTKPLDALIKDLEQAGTETTAQTLPCDAETLALLKILALGQQDIAAGRLRPAADVIAEIRAKYESRA